MIHDRRRSVVVWQATDHFRACLSRSTNDCNASVHSFASERGVLEEGDSCTMGGPFRCRWTGIVVDVVYGVVKTLLRIFGGQTTCSLWNCWQTPFPIWAESSRTRVYEMLMPRCDNLSTNSLFRVCACNIIPTYVGTGVSCAALCLGVTSPVVGCSRLCFIQLNFSIWAIASAPGVVHLILKYRLSPRSFPKWHWPLTSHVDL